MDVLEKFEKHELCENPKNATLAIGSMILAAFLGASGKVGMRYGHVFKTNSVWYIGLLLNQVVYPILEVVAYSAGTLTLVAPFSALALIFNLMLASFILGERNTRSRTSSCVLILCGVVTSTWILKSSDNSLTDPQHWLSLDKYSSYFSTPSARLYFILWPVLVGSILVSSFFFRTVWLKGISYGVSGALCGGNMFFAIGLYKIMFEHGLLNLSYIINPIFLICLIMAPLLASANAFFLNLGLKKGESMVIIPPWHGAEVTTAALSGILVMGEFHKMSPQWTVLYFLSIGLIWVGIGISIICERVVE